MLLHLHRVSRPPNLHIARPLSSLRHSIPPCLHTSASAHLNPPPELYTSVAPHLYTCIEPPDLHVRMRMRTARERVNTPIWPHSRHSGSVILAHPLFSIISPQKQPRAHHPRSSASLCLHQLPPLLITARLDTLCSTAARPPPSLAPTRSSTPP